MAKIEKIHIIDNYKQKVVVNLKLSVFVILRKTKKLSGSFAHLHTGTLKQRTFIRFLILLSILFSFFGHPCTLIAQNDTTRQTILYTLPWDDMPIDLSFVVASEK